MQKKIAGLIKQDIQVKNALLKSQIGNIEKLAKLIISTIRAGNKILIFGNGGSAADSLHMTAELVGRFRKERRPFPAIALPANISTLTALANDYTFDCIFERQVEALGKKGDLAIGISTSGKSKNVLRGILKASKLKMKTAVVTGKYKGRLSQIPNVSIRVPSSSTPLIQEAHVTIIHILCELVEDALC